MTPESLIQRVFLAVESLDLEAGARQFSERLLPDTEIVLCTLPEFEESLQPGYQSNDLHIIMLHANEQGHLENGLPIIENILRSNVPVLVIRHSRGGAVPDASLKRVVVPLDGSTTAGQAVPIASTVARSLNIPVHFIMVIDPSRVIPPAYAYDPDAWGMIEELRQTSHWALSQAEAAMERDGVDVNSQLLFGPINASLSANIGEGDLVVMTTHGAERHHLRNRESVARRTLVSIAQPMLVMRAQRQTPIVVDGYQACSWVEPLQQEPVRMS